MDKRFFQFLVYLVVYLNVALAGTSSSRNPSESVSSGREPTRYWRFQPQLESAKTNKRDLNLHLESIAEIKGFVNLVRAIVIDNLDEIGVGNANDKSKKNNHAIDLFLENGEEENLSDSRERIYRDDDNVGEFDTSRELLEVASDLGLQPETLNILTRGFNDAIKKFLYAMLQDWKRHAKKRRFEETRVVTLMDEIVDILEETITILRRKSDGTKKIGYETGDETNVREKNLRELPTRDTAENGSSSLRDEFKALKRLIVENLCNSEISASEKPEKVPIFDDFFAFFIMTTERLKTNNEIKEYLKIVFRRIAQIYDSLKKSIQTGRGNRKVPNEENDKKQINLKDQKEENAKLSNWKLLPALNKHRHYQSGNPVVPINIMNVTEDNELINASESTDDSLKNGTNLTELTIRVTTEKNLLDDDYSTSIFDNRTKDYANEEKTPKTIVDKIARNASLVYGDPRIIGEKENNISSVQEEEIVNNAKQTDLKSKKASTKDKESEDSPNRNITTKINHYSNNPERSFRKMKNNSRAQDDIGTTMRFGSDEMFNVNANKKVNETVIADEKIRLPGEKIDDASANITQTSESTNESLKREIERKRYVMDIILESVNAIIAENGTKSTRPTTLGKSLR